MEIHHRIQRGSGETKGGEELAAFFGGGEEGGGGGGGGGWDPALSDVCYCVE